MTNSNDPLGLQKHINRLGGSEPSLADEAAFCKRRYKMEMPKTPECDKMLEIKDKSQMIGEFLEWLRGSQDIVFAKYHGDELFPEYLRMEELLAKYFDIDLDEIERERRALLEYCRQNHHCCEQKVKHD